LKQRDPSEWSSNRKNWRALLQYVTRCWKVSTWWDM
jgi:hypothetical protein